MSKNTNTASAKSVKSVKPTVKPVEVPVKSGEEKVKFPIAKLAEPIIKNIRTKRADWVKDDSNKFTGNMNGVVLECFRIEKAGKASVATIAHAVLNIKLPSGDLVITGPFAALAWKSLNKVPKVRGKATMDWSTVADALRALGV
jgi:hypothetical protein